MALVVAIGVATPIAHATGPSRGSDGAPSAEAVEHDARTAGAPRLVRRSATMSRPDHPSPSPVDGLRMVSAEVIQDVAAQQVTARFTLAGEPTAETESVLYLNLGIWDSTRSTCELSFRIYRGSIDHTGSGARFTSRSGLGLTVGPNLGATDGRSGNVLTVTSAAHESIGSAPWDCAWAYNLPPTAANETAAYSRFHPETLTPAYAAPASLGVSVAGRSTRALKPGRRAKVRVTVLNAGEEPATGVRLKAVGKKTRVRGKRSRRIGTLAPGESRAVTFRVSLKGRAKRAKVTFHARGDGLAAQRAVKLKRKGSKPRGKKGR